MLKQLIIYMQKNEHHPLPHIINKNYLKIDLKVKTKILKLLKAYIRKNLAILG